MSDNNNFVPSQDNYKPLRPFQLFIKSNFPFIENTFEALDNYGLYCKVVEYLNDVISNENTVESNVTALYNAFVSLNNYVSNYFDNLNVQTEINNKLDEMAESGQLQALVNNIFQDLQDQINSLGSGSPNGVYATVSDLTTADPDHSKIYVVTEDGYWYYYNTTLTTWTRGGVYQASINTLDVDNLIDNVDLLNKISRPDDISLTEVEWGFYNTDGTFSTSSSQISMTTPFYIKDDVKVTYKTGFRGQLYTWVSSNVLDGCTKSSWLTGEQTIRAEGGKYITLSLALNTNSTETLDDDTFWEDLTVDSLTLNEIVDKNTIMSNDNYYDINGAKFNSGYLIRNTGVNATFAKGYSTDYIPIKVGDVISAHSGTNGSGYSIISIYNKNKTCISSPLNGGSEVADLVTGSYTATENGFVRFSCNIDVFASSYFKINNISILENKSIKERISNLETNQDTINDLYKLFSTVGVIGDSYSAVRTYYIDSDNEVLSAGDIEENSWGKAMERNSNRDYKIFAKGGLECTDWLTDTDKGYPVASQTSNLCQAYIIGLGINDSARHNTTYIGTTADINTTNEDLNENSFIGNYAKIIQKMKKLQKGVKIFVMTMGNYTSSANEDTYEDYNDAIRDIAEFFDDVYLIDLYNLYHSQYAETNGFFQKQTINGHFTPLAYQKVAKMISNEISKIMYNNSEDFDLSTFIGTEYADDIWG